MPRNFSSTRGENARQRRAVEEVFERCQYARGVPFADLFVGFVKPFCLEYVGGVAVEVQAVEPGVAGAIGQRLDGVFDIEIRDRLHRIHG